MKGLKDGLAGKMMIVAELPYETTDPTVNSQMVSLKASGADIFFNVTTPKFAAQAIKKAAEIGWKPVHLLNSVSASVGAVMKPAGLENAQGRAHRGLRQGPDRSGLEGRSRHEGMGRLHGQILSRRRQDLELPGLRLQHRTHDGAGAASNAATISRAKT